jgi:hypothetical protein
MKLLYCLKEVGLSLVAAVSSIQILNTLVKNANMSGIKKYSTKYFSNTNLNQDLIIREEVLYS